MALLVDVDSWSTEYEACERLNQTILANIAQRDKRQNSPEQKVQLTASIQVGLNQFETELRQLKSKLDGSAKSITFEENERRQRQVEFLQSQYQQLQTKYKNSILQDREVRPSGSQSPWNATNTGTSKPNTNPFEDDDDVEPLRRPQADILEEQNRGLETLSQTISRQRELAKQLGLEVEDQNEILDNLANTMDRVDTRVNVETGNLGQINRRDSTWGYWLVIIVLLIAIVIVAVL